MERTEKRKAEQKQALQNMRSSCNKWVVVSMLQRKAKAQERIKAMGIDDYRKAIEQETGIPAKVLTGKTLEENLRQAEEILAYKKDQTSQNEEKTTRGQFAAWMRDNYGTEDQDADADGLAALREQARVEAGGYPKVRDGGQISAENLPDLRSPQEQFAEWFRDVSAWDPRKSHSMGW